MNKKGILGPTILILIAFLIFAFVLGYLFLMPLIVVGTNIIILYFLFLRIYTEITKYNRGNTYAYSAVAAALILFITKNFIPVWWITTWALMTFIIVHVYILFKKK
jgi:hypothetical protein